MPVFRKFDSDAQKKAARCACYLMTIVFITFACFTLAYPARYPITTLGQVGLMPAASWLSYFMTYKLYQKDGLLQYFAMGFGLILVGGFSCYAAFLISGLPAEQFVWAVVALVIAAMWFGYGAGICLVVKLLQRRR